MSDLTSGALDFSRLVLRATVGGTMLAHGVRHARSLEGTAGWFGGIGFAQPELQAAASAVVEIGAGTALIAGFATPAASAAVVGTMAVAARTVHLSNGFFIVGEGYEYVLSLAATSTAIAALGPGRYSVDAHVGRLSTLKGTRVGLLSAGLGLVGAAVQLAAFWRKPGTNQA